MCALHIYHQNVHKQGLGSKTIVTQTGILQIEKNVAMKTSHTG